MKKFTLTTLMMLAIVVTLFAKKVEINDARQAGKNFYYEMANSRSTVSYQAINIIGDLTWKASGETAFYIFNVNMDDGYVIVSADDAAQPVLGYSFTGSFDEENLPPQLKGWLDNYAMEIDYIRNMGLQADLELTEKWNHLLTTDPSSLKPDKLDRAVEPLLTCLWDQTFPYNAMCPEDAASGSGYNGRVPVGCVATAMAQIMYYWRFPDQGMGSHCISPLQPQYGQQCADFGNTTYVWEGMNDSPNGECDPIALLSWHCGISVNMQYGPNGSGAQVASVDNALINYFKYANSAMWVRKSTYTTTNWENLLKADLDAGQPIEYAGYDATSGHAWVCDGYQGTNYFHFNWGWGGSSNGYYYLNNLNPGGYTFNTDQQAVVHIVPSSTYYPEGCTGQTVVDQYNYGTIEDGSGPVADYANNVNCSWLIAPDDSIMKITLTFIRLDTDPADVITVYDGSTTSATVLGTYSGTTLPGAVSSTGPQMLVTFTSNASVSGNGFMAQYVSQAIPFCGSNTTLTDPQGDINDGSGRFSYRNSSTCKWKILPQNSIAVTLVITDINIEPVKDYIEVYDYVTSQKLATYSGTTIPPPVTSGGKMMVVFKSNASVRGEGFSASYTTVVGVEDQTGVNELTVFPNPSNGIINVDFKLKQQGNVTLEVMNISGTTVLRNDLGIQKDEVSEMIDLSSQPSGIYVLRVYTDKGVVNRKVVKN